MITSRTVDLVSKTERSMNDCAAAVLVPNSTMPPYGAFLAFQLTWYVLVSRKLLSLLNAW